MDTTPLKYRWKSVLCHEDDMGEGHWAATVTDKSGVNHIYDEEVCGEDLAFLYTNPHHDMQATVLMYTRMEPRGI
jgi:ubiquitin C-terminal hydrolase